MKITNVIVASDVNTRDGIGIEVYDNEKMILEVFRDDSFKTRSLTLFEKDVPLKIVEESIRLFKSKIDWDFID